jgi:hypothetical protein
MLSSAVASSIFNLRNENANMNLAPTTKAFEEKIEEKLICAHRMEGGSTAVRLASGNELCTIYSRPGKTGLKVELRRFDTAKEEFTSAGSVIIKGAAILQSKPPCALALERHLNECHNYRQKGLHKDGPRCSRLCGEQSHQHVRHGSCFSARVLRC